LNFVAVILSKYSTSNVGTILGKEKNSAQRNKFYMPVLKEYLDLHNKSTNTHAHMLILLHMFVYEKVFKLL